MTARRWYAHITLTLAAIPDGLITLAKLATTTAYSFMTTNSAGTIGTTTVTGSRAVATDANGLPTASSTTSTELGYVHGVTSAIQTQLDAKLGTTATANRFIVADASGNVGVNAAVTGSRIVSTTAAGLPQANASLTSNRLAYSDGAGSLASNAALTQNRVVIGDANGLPTPASAITASRAVVSDTNGVPTHATTTSTEIGYVNGVTSAIQTQIDTKLIKTGTANRFLVTDGSGNRNDLAVTASRAVATDSSGLPVASATTATELGYVNGVTSAIQTQLGTKLANTGTAYRLVAADSGGTRGDLAALTASRGLKTDANGQPVATTMTAANLEAAMYTSSNTSTITHTFSANSLSSAVASQAVCYAAGSNTGAASQSISSTSYANFASYAYTPRASTSTVKVNAFGIYVHTSGTATFAIRRGTTVIGGGTTEPTATLTTAISLRADDTGHGGSTQTYNFSVKNSTPAGSMNYCWIEITDTI